MRDAMHYRFLRVTANCGYANEQQAAGEGREGAEVNNSVLAGVIVGAVVVTAVGAIAANSGFNPLQDYATVVAVEPAYDVKRTPRAVCGDETVLEQEPVKDEKRIAGTAIGAVVGGVLGNQVGSGSGNTAATVAGAAAGGYAGSKIQKKMQENNVKESTEESCATVYDIERTPVGYDVTYELEGAQRTVRMDHDPGDRIPVKDGEPVVSSS
jgi:uncharacterized protein YcfJ